MEIQWPTKLLKPWSSEGAANDREIFTLWDRLHTYEDILTHYRLERTIFSTSSPISI